MTLGKSFDLYGAQFLQMKMCEQNTAVVRGKLGLILFLQKRLSLTHKLGHVLGTLVVRGSGYWPGQGWKSGMKFLLGISPSDQGPKEEKEKEEKNLQILLLACQP